MISIKNLILGIISIIIGVFAFIYPLSSVETASKVAGISTLFLSIYLIASSKKKMDSSKIVGIVTILFSILLIYSAFNRFTSIYYYARVVGIVYYLTAVLIITSGVYVLFYEKKNEYKIMAVLGILLGIVYIAVGSLVQNPVYLGSVIGIYLIMFGLSRIMGFKYIRTKDIRGGIIKKISRKLKRKRKK